MISRGLFDRQEASVETEGSFGKDLNRLGMETFTMGIARDAGRTAARSAGVAVGF